MQSELLDLATLSERTGIALRKLRYCVDHELAPAKTWFLSEDELGRPRTFDIVTGTFLACSAFLLEAGCRREAVKTLMSMVSRLVPADRRFLNVRLDDPFIRSSGPGLFEVGDAFFARLTTGKKSTGWLDTRRNQPEPLERFNPRIIIAVDIGRIRDLVCDRE